MSTSQKIINGLKDYLGFKKDYELANYLGYKTISLIKNGLTPIPYQRIIDKIENINPYFIIRGELPVVLDVVETENKNTETELQWFLRDETIAKPYKNNESDTGYDIKWDGVLHNVDESKIEAEAVVLSPLSRRTFGTGVSVILPEGYGIQVRPRSGLANKHGLTVVNSPGTVDNAYTGEIRVILCNMSNESVTINKGDRIAQLVLEEIVVLNESVSYGHAKDFKTTVRGEKGFGESGVK